MLPVLCDPVEKLPFVLKIIPDANTYSDKTERAEIQQEAHISKHTGGRTDAQVHSRTLTVAVAAAAAASASASSSKIMYFFSFYVHWHFACL